MMEPSTSSRECQDSGVEKYGKSYGTTTEKMVYDGAFYFKPGMSGQWTGTNNNYTVEKNPAYWDSKDVKSEKVAFQVIKDPTSAYNVYKQGNLSYVPVNTPSLYNAHKKDKNLVNTPLSETEYIQFNQSGMGTSSPETAKALKNQDIRAALVFATNRQGVVNTVYPACKPATSFTPAGTGIINGEDFTKYAKQKNYTYNPTKAKAFFQKGLKELGLTSLSIDFEVNADSPANKNYADYFTKAFETTLPGLKVNEKLVPAQQLTDDGANGNFDLIDSTWIADYTDPSTYLQLFQPGSSFNRGKFNNPSYNLSIKKASSLPDVMSKSAYFSDYKAAEKALSEGYNIDPIMFYSSPMLVTPNLAGVSWNSTSDPDLHAVYIK